MLLLGFVHSLAAGAADVQAVSAACQSRHQVAEDSEARMVHHSVTICAGIYSCSGDMYLSQECENLGARAGARWIVRRGCLIRSMLSPAVERAEHPSTR